MVVGRSVTKEDGLSKQAVKPALGQGYEVFVNKKLSFFAYCPAHETRTSDFQGVDHQGWLFRCKEGKSHLSHIFHAKPSKDSPKRAEDVAAWLEAQRVKQALEEGNHGGQ